MHYDVLTPVAEHASDSESPGEGWWFRFQEFGLRSLSKTAQTAIETDARFIVDHCILPPSAEAWNSRRIRTGIVVGAVQSGKTASMLAVSAMLLDRGLSVLVILTGTRLALWRQTLHRLTSQLDGSSLNHISQSRRRKARVLVPRPASILASDKRPTPKQYMQEAKPKIKLGLKNARPVILVIPKQDDHMLAVVKTMQDCVGELHQTLPERNLHMVVFDDEADEGSVLDAGGDKLTPHRIQMLWKGRRTTTADTFSPNLYATYVAYTATPQANFLQADTNPLSPQDFCAALRTPSKSGGSLDRPRQPSFTEPLGLRAHYCGGEAWYINSHGLTEGETFPEPDDYDSQEQHAAAVEICNEAMVHRGVKAFLVAAALRDIAATEKGHQSMADIEPGQPLQEDAHRTLPPSTNMLIHPSGALKSHWSTAQRVIRWANAIKDDKEAETRDLKVTGEGWLKDLEFEEQSWAEWLASYRATQEAIEDYPAGLDLQSLTAPDWAQVKNRLRKLIPHVQVRVINSDPEADDRPLYEPLQDGNGVWHAPQDQLTIYVSGNVMSRGITIGGLVTTVFYRPAHVPVADTQMQMQRWFGYRGTHYSISRLFAFDDQLRLFRSYHEHDTVMRREICKSMDDGTFKAPRVILQGSRALATAKVRTQRLPLHPGATPSVRLLEVENPDLIEHNDQALRQVLQTGVWKDVNVNGEVRGRLRQDPWSLNEAADFLDQLRYSQHDPLVEGDPRYARWLALEAHLGLHSEEGKLLRTPAINPHPSNINVRNCPYTLAAYLRLWHAALKRGRIDGLTTEDQLESSWSLEYTDLPKNIPVYVGLRHGPLPEITQGPLANQCVRPMVRAVDRFSLCQVRTLWGTRGTQGQYLGDQRFDYHHFNTAQVPQLHTGGPFWRPRNHAALMLIHVVKPHTNGMAHHPLHGVTVGLSLPHGGPEQFAAIGGNKGPWNA